MTETPRPCPNCGGRLSEPISGDVHCYLECTACGERFDLKDPRIAPADGEVPTRA